MLLLSLLYTSTFTFIAATDAWSFWQGSASGDYGLQEIVGSNQASTSVDISPTTNCSAWLGTSPIRVPVDLGINFDLHDDDLEDVVDCLRREEAVEARNRIAEIEVILPDSSDFWMSLARMIELTETLPKLEVIKWPRARHSFTYRYRARLHQHQMKQNKTWSIEMAERNHFSNPINCEVDSVDADVTQEDAMDKIYEEVVSCPNVRSLNLRIYEAGCVSSVGLQSWDFLEGDRFPDLESLTLSGYLWDDTPFAADLTEFSTLERWDHAMDWTKLKSLDLSFPPVSFMDYFSKGQLRGLKSFMVRPEYGIYGDEKTLCGQSDNVEKHRQALISFVAGLPPLEKLGISGLGRLLSVEELEHILQIHGPSLKHFGLHEFERDCGQVREAMDAEYIRKLGLAAPNLESITLDVNRTRNAPFPELLPDFSAFKHLQRLTAHFPLDDPNQRRFARQCREEPGEERCIVPTLLEPQLDRDVAAKMFRDIKSQQCGGTLQHMTLYTGDWGRREGAGFFYPDHRDFNRPVMVHYGADDEGNVASYGTCAERLRNEQNMDVMRSDLDKLCKEEV